LMLIGNPGADEFDQVWHLRTGATPVRVTNPAHHYRSLSLTANARRIATVQVEDLTRPGTGDAIMMDRLD
jgi:hypothetical protein